MRFFIYFFIFSLFLNSNAFAKDGFGELKFTQQSFGNFLDYLRGDGDPNAAGVMMTSGTPLGFAINQKGNNTFYYYCPKKYAGDCMPRAEIDAQNKCTFLQKEEKLFGIVQMLKFQKKFPQVRLEKFLKKTVG